MNETDKNKKVSTKKSSPKPKSTKTTATAKVVKDTKKQKAETTVITTPQNSKLIIKVIGAIIAICLLMLILTGLKNILGEKVEFIENLPETEITTINHKTYSSDLVSFDYPETHDIEIEVNPEREYLVLTFKKLENNSSVRVSLAAEENKAAVDTYMEQSQDEESGVTRAKVGLRDMVVDMVTTPTQVVYLFNKNGVNITATTTKPITDPVAVDVFEMIMRTLELH